MVQYLLGVVCKHTRTKKAEGPKKFKLARNLCAIGGGFGSNLVKLENKGQYFIFDTIMVQKMLVSVYKRTET